MDNYQLRSEILSSGTKYYVQSNFVVGQGAVVTSLFHEGKLLSTRTTPCEPNLTVDLLRGAVRRIHDEARSRITTLLDIRDRLKKDVDPRAHLRLGEALYRQKLYKEAMAEVIRAIKLGMEDALGYSILGNCLLTENDLEKAIKAFRKGIEVSPEYPDLHNDLGCTFLRMEQCREAVAAFERALELNKYYQAAFLNLAVALALNVVLKQDYELSRDLRERMKHVLSMAVQLKPSVDSEEFREAARAVDDERYDVAFKKLSAIREAEAHMVQDDLSLEVYLILKFRSESLTNGEIDRIIGRVASELEANPGYADLQNDLGILYAAKCKLFIDHANEAFDAALKINPGFRKAAKNLKLVANDRQGIHFLLRALLD